MPEQHRDRSRMLASDQDRTAMARKLDAHLTDGRLTAEEYGDRLAKVYTARTYGELDALVSDLPANTPVKSAVSEHVAKSAEKRAQKRKGRSGPRTAEDAYKLGAAWYGISFIIFVTGIFITYMSISISDDATGVAFGLPVLVLMMLMTGLAQVVSEAYDRQAELLKEIERLETMPPR